MAFTGEYELTIDAKGRLAFPADIRGRLHPDKDGEFFYLTLGLNGALWLYPEKKFHQMVEEVEAGLIQDEAVQEFVEIFFPLSTRLMYDSANRVRIPDKMMERAGLTNPQVVLLGMNDHLEIRDRATWEAELQERLSRQREIVARFKQHAKSSRTAPGAMPTTTEMAGAALDQQ